MFVKSRERQMNKACARCGEARVRCQMGPDQRGCQRCILLRVECVFTQSRRGRAIGSKNVKTRQRLLEDTETGETRQATVTSSGTLPLTIPESLTWALPAMRIERLRADTLSNQSKASPKLLVNEEVANGERSFSEEGENLGAPLISLLNLARDRYHFRYSQSISELRLSPTINLDPAERAILSKWSSAEVTHVVRRQVHYSNHSIHDCKRDVGVGLDAVQAGVVSESRVIPLFEAYWSMIHPQWSVLDPQLHTARHVRDHSAFLFTVILAISSTALATGPNGNHELVFEAISLQAHAERTLLVTYATGAKSCEIIQAHILFHMWSFVAHTYLDDQRWVRMAMCSRMALELGLHRRRGDVRLTTPYEARVEANMVRIRAFLIMLENRWTLMAGDAIPGIFSLTLSENEIGELGSMSCETTTGNTCALYLLSRFFREELEKIATLANEPFGSLRLMSESTWVQTFVDDWTKRWCTTQRSLLQQWYLRHMAMAGHLVILCRILREMQDSDSRHALVGDIIIQARSILEAAHSHAEHLHTLNHSVALPFAALVLQRLSHDPEPIVARCTLRFAGDPSRPGIRLPTFCNFNAEQMIAILSMTSSMSTASQGLGVAASPASYGTRATELDDLSGFFCDPAVFYLFAPRNHDVEEADASMPGSHIGARLDRADRY